MATPTTSTRGGVNGTKGKAVTDTTGIELRLPPCVKLPEEIVEAGLPAHVFNRMQFLWEAAHALRLTSPAASRLYSCQLLELSGERHDNSGALPGWVRSSMCQDCGSVFTPGVNCRTRLRHRTRASPSVKRPKRGKEMDPAGKGKKRAKRYRNDVVTTCSLCGKARAQGGMERRAHRKKRGEQDAAASVAPPETPKVSNERGKSFTPMNHPGFSTPGTAGGGPQQKKTPRSGSSNQRPRGGKANGTPFSFEASKEVRIMEGNQGSSFGTMWAGGRGQEAGFGLQEAVRRLSGSRLPATPSGSKPMGGVLGAPSPAGDGASVGRKRGSPSLLEKIRKENKKGRKISIAPASASASASASPATKTL